MKNFKENRSKFKKTGKTTGQINFSKKDKISAPQATLKKQEKKTGQKMRSKKLKTGQKVEMLGTLAKNEYLKIVIVIGDPLGRQGVEFLRGGGTQKRH